MRSKDEIIKDIEGMGFKNTVPDVWKSEVDGDTFYGVDFRSGGAVAFKWQDNERITDVQDVRVEKDDKLIMLNAAIDVGFTEPTAEDVPEEVIAVIADQPDEPETMPAPIERHARQMQKVDEDLTKENIRKYICPKATDEELFTFLKLCEHRGLNPFIKDAYLVKYKDGQAATMIVGKDAFTRKAEESPQFDGFEAGVIIKNDDGVLENREGQFVDKGEHLIGGWAKVYRKDRSKPFTSTVSMTEYNTSMSSWKKIPATMIRKVALVQALREAFPSDLGGCYDSAEMDQARVDKR